VALPSEHSQTAYNKGMYAFHPVKLWSYWIKVHQLRSA